MELMHLPISQQIPPQKFRVGDLVTVTNPEFVTRVGYPMSFEDAYEEVKKLYLPEIEAMLDRTIFKPTEPITKLPPGFVLETCSEESKELKRIIRAMANMHLQAKGFGGKERTIHTKFDPAEQGKTYEIFGKKVCKTGTYYPGWSECSYEGEWDGGPGGLDNCKTHVLLDLGGWISFGCNKFDGRWIESCNVQLSKRNGACNSTR